MKDEQTSRTTAVRTYAIQVDGFPEMNWCARTPAGARVQCWRAYSSYEEVSFRRFLAMSRIRRVPNPQGVGDRISVCGRPATRVLPRGQYVGFMRDGSSEILCAHPADVQELANGE